MDLNELIEVVKVKVGDLIQKPKMTEKLLSKPPFRFLHDTISAITVTTGFGEGLYSGEELDSAAMTEKTAKIAYLEKIFSLVGICKGNALDVRAAKVVAGLEPENTNAFLVALAECAADSNLDNAEAVRRCLDGKSPSTNIPLKKSAAAPVAESKGEVARASSKSAAPPASAHVDSETKGYEAKGAASIEADLPGAGAGGERGKSRGGTRGGKPNQATADIGLRGIAGNAAPNLDAFIEKCDGSEATTQDMLSAIITKPKLSPKLLSKPPFRFLHDIIMEVIRVTGFGANLYNAEESDSALVAEKPQKVAFLEKIIKLVGIQLNTLVEARPAKIVAGLDPQNTNNFLQLLAVAAQHTPDSTAGVRSVLEAGGEATAHIPVVAAPQSVEPAKQTPKEEKQRPARQAQPAVTESAPPAEPKERERERESVHSAGETRREVVDEKTMDEGGDGESGETKRSARPTTARRRPPKVKDGAKEVAAKDTASTNKKAEGILIDGQDDDDDDGAIVDETRLADDVKAESKSAGGADPQSKLVKDILSRQAEQEVARRTVSQGNEEESGSPSDADAGKSGSGIRLGRLKKSGVDKKGGGGAAPLGESDMERLRAAIQMLVQHTGPLGTCMDFIQDDIGLMSAELHKWEEECRKYEAQADEERRKSREKLRPLQVELSDLEEQIAETAVRISATKANIARNDDRCQQMLKLMATA